jgi:hypothetical protein
MADPISSASPQSSRVGELPESLILAPITTSPLLPSSLSSASAETPEREIAMMRWGLILLREVRR